MNFETIVGIEIHVEMKTKSKMFSLAPINFGAAPNSQVVALDMAFPGTLPILNKECVRKAVMMSIILNCKQPKYMEFDRKNYYYPDLPKGYQITQFFNPVGVDGLIYSHIIFHLLYAIAFQFFVIV